MMKQFFNNKEFQLDEILFESRNKAYGAYVLRNQADKVLTKAMFLGVGLFAAMATIPIVINHLKSDDVILKPNKTELVVRPIDIIEDEKPAEQPPAQQPQQQQVKTFDSSVPTPTANPPKETPIAKQSEYNNAVAGTQNIDGETPTSTYIPQAVAPTTAPTPPIPPTKPAPQPQNNTIQNVVDIEASFPGGINVFREKIQSNFDMSSVESSEEILRAEVTFVVEKDGSISGIKAVGSDREFNREAERAIKNVRGKWSPAKLNGEIVRSYFRIPISMRIE